MKSQCLTSGLAIGLVMPASNDEFCNKKQSKAYLFAYAATSPVQQGNKKNNNEKF